MTLRDQWLLKGHTEARTFRLSCRYPRVPQVSMAAASKQPHMGSKPQLGSRPPLSPSTQHPLALRTCLWDSHTQPKITLILMHMVTQTHSHNCIAPAQCAEPRPRHRESLAHNLLHTHHNHSYTHGPATQLHTPSITQTHGFMKSLALSSDGSWALGWEADRVNHLVPHPSLHFLAPPGISSESTSLYGVGQALVRPHNTPWRGLSPTKRAFNTASLALKMMLCKPDPHFPLRVTYTHPSI